MKFENQSEREKFWQPHAEKEKIMEEYEYAKKYIEEASGLKLSNIELVGLRNIAEEFMKEMVKNEIGKVSGHNRLVPYEEIPARFFWKFYGIRQDEFNSLFPTDKDEKGDPITKESTKKYFQKLQEERHLI